MTKFIIIAFFISTSVYSKGAIELLESLGPNKAKVPAIESLIENGHSGDKQQNLGFRDHGTPGEYMMVIRSIAIAALNSITNKNIPEPNYLEGGDVISGDEEKKTLRHRKASQQVHMLVKRLALHFAENPNDIFEAMHTPSKFYKISDDKFTGDKILTLEYMTKMLGRTFVIDTLPQFWEFIKQKNKNIGFISLESPFNQKIELHRSKPTYFAATNVNKDDRRLAQFLGSSNIKSLRLTNSYIAGATITDSMKALSLSGSSISLAKISRNIKSHKNLEVLSIELGDDSLGNAAYNINYVLASNKNLKYLQLGAFDNVTKEEFRQLFGKVDLARNKQLVGLDITNILVNHNQDFMVNIPPQNRLKFIRLLGIDERYLPSVQEKIMRGYFMPLEELTLHISNLVSEGHLESFLKFLHNYKSKHLPNLKKLTIKTAPSYKVDASKIGSSNLILWAGEHSAVIE